MKENKLEVGYKSISEWQLKIKVIKASNILLLICHSNN